MRGHHQLRHLSLLGLPCAEGFASAARARGGNLNQRICQDLTDYASISRSIYRKFPIYAIVTRCGRDVQTDLLLSILNLRASCVGRHDSKMAFSLAAAAVALAVSVAHAQRPIDQIEHIVIFMQENRAYDHYFGMLDGVRGFNDRTTTILPSGLSAFFQPSNQAAPQDDYILPFPANTLSTSSICMVGVT